MNIEFQEITMEGCAIYCILPGQVHYGVATLNTTAWVLALAPVCIREDFRTVLADFAIMNKPIPLPPEKGAIFKESFLLLTRLERQGEPDTEDHTLSAMLEVCISLFVAAGRGDKRLMIPALFNDAAFLPYRQCGVCTEVPCCAQKARNQF